ncbi:unnamed protein product [Urochloa decumbens]|uniref:Cytochrome P450 n=1 Tax=Urochloa decumbens TaxID=240449 RepID=A0ABC9AKQ5_9POAL
MAASCCPVMLLRLGQVPTVVASSAAAAEEALKTRDLSFSGRPRLLMADRLYYGTRDMVFAPYGERWRQLRRVCVAALLDGVRAAAADGAAAVLNLSDLLIAYSNAVISRATFGDAGGAARDGPDGGDGAVAVAGGRADKLDRKARRTAEEIDRLIERVVADHRRWRRCGGRRSGDGDDDCRDFVDVLLDLSEAGEEIDGVRLDTVTIKATILDMLVAGTDTTYTLLEWAMAELVNHPTQMRKLQDEVRTAAGGITEDDLPRLPYLKAVIKETLRLHPPGPLLLPRETLEDTELQGYHVPARTRVVINAWAIGRDPATWERAEEFVPERFAATDGDGEAAEYHKMGVDFRFLPFGAGRRGCPGVGFAVPSMELALASLLYHFDWEVPGGDRKPSAVDMSEVNGLSVRLKTAMASKHGPVMLLRLGRVPIVVASSAAAAQEVMKTHDLAFASRPRMRMAERLIYGRDMVFAPYGEHWRQARRVCVLHLLSQRRVQSLRRARELEAAAMVDRVRRGGVQAVKVTALIHVPARSRVIVNAWAIARDPAAWDRPDEFVPERFAGGDDLTAADYLLGQDFRFVPFGAGRRGCPGVGFAVPSMELALASLLYHFDWELPAGGPSKLEMHELNGLTVRFKATLRLVAKPWSR